METPTYPTVSPVHTSARRSWRNRLAVVAVAAVAVVAPVAAGCSSDSSASAGSASAAVAEGAVLLDVRTPEEFAGGHLDGAINIDVQAPDFDARVAALDPNATYLVYCRSGNRSGQAVSRMSAAGFTNLSNIGSVAEANAATGVPVVR